MKEDEISLTSYIKVIFHQKLMIFSVTFLVLFLGILFSIRSPKSYESSIILQIGNIDIFTNGISNTFVPETLSQIEEKLNNGFYDGVLQKKVDSEKILSVEVIVPKKDNSTKESDMVVINAKAKDKESGQIYLKALGEAIIAEQNKKINQKKDYLENMISVEKSKLRALEKSPYLSSLQYLYISHLGRIDDAQMGLNSLEKSSIIKEPPKEASLVKSKLLTNVIIALIFGLVLGIASGFLKEFWEKNRDFILKD